jgi:hypothetical protein
MTLVTTPGSASADSYATVAEANTHFIARGITTWTGTDTVKENALRRATTYLDNQYRGRFVGIAATQTQALAWPRTDGNRDPWHLSFTYPLVDINGFQIAIDAVPTQIKNACIEVALLALTGVSLEPTLTRGGAIKSIGKSVGPLRKDITYVDGAPVVDRYLVIEGLLRGLVTSTPGASSGNVKLVRG